MGSASFRPATTTTTTLTATTTTRYLHTDHLGSTQEVTDANGTVVQTLDYYPYGSKRLSSGTDVSQREYIGEMFDEGSQLSYLNARYYEGSRAQFLSEDPVFWEVGQTKDGKVALLNPQSQNSYSYALGNPILKKDPDGRFVPEAIVGGLIGGVVGFGIQGATDLVTWNLSSPSKYAGSIAGAATFGAIVGATDGLSLFYTGLAGGVAGTVQSGTTQSIDIINGTQSGYNGSTFVNDIAINTVSSLVPGLKIGGVTAGRGSFQAVERQIYTKLGTGTLSPTNISMSTYAKMTVSTGAQQASGATLQGVLNNLKSILGQISASIGSLGNSKQK